MWEKLLIHDHLHSTFVSSRLVYAIAADTE